MIAWFLKYWQIVAIAAALVGLGWYHEHAIAKAYRQGATDREASALKEAAAKVEVDSAARRKELDQRAADLDQLEARTQGERAALNTARAGINNALSAGLAQLSTQGVDVAHEIKSVPDDAVNARYRLALQRANAAERERASHP